MGQTPPIYCLVTCLRTSRQCLSPEKSSRIVNAALGSNTVCNSGAKCRFEMTDYESLVRSVFKVSQYNGVISIFRCERSDNIAYGGCVICKAISAVTVTKQLKKLYTLKQRNVNYLKHKENSQDCIKWSLEQLQH